MVMVPPSLSSNTRFLSTLQRCVRPGRSSRIPIFPQGNGPRHPFLSL